MILMYLKTHSKTIKINKNTTHHSKNINIASHSKFKNKNRQSKFENHTYVILSRYK